LINPKEFLDEPEELHAFTQGICEVICPWPPYRKSMSQKRQIEIFDEYHYYMLGRALGIFAWLGIALIVKKLLI
jgi:hypothetical protein